MREIKFRAWDKRINKMCVVVDITWGDVLEPTIIYDESDGERHHSNMKFIEVMQYTGLKDKNGKEIYEGDILRYDEYGRTKTYIVEWGETTDSEYEGFTRYGMGIPEGAGHEVIGNIYENEDLLKK